MKYIMLKSLYVLHLDLDCFFVSAHRTLDDSLKDIPVAVGGRSNLNIFSTKKRFERLARIVVLL